MSLYNWVGLCVPRSPPNKSILRKEKKLGSNHAVKFSKARGTTKKIGKERVHREASFKSVNLTSAIRALPDLRRGYKRSSYSLDQKPENGCPGPSFQSAAEALFFQNTCLEQHALLVDPLVFYGLCIFNFSCSFKPRKKAHFREPCRGFVEEPRIRADRTPF